MPNHFTHLWTAINQRNKEKVKQLLTQKSVIKIINTKPTGHTPLMLAAKLGEKEIVEALLASGADHLIRDNLNLVNATSLALSKGHSEIAEIIEEHANFASRVTNVSVFFKKITPQPIIDIMIDYLKPTTIQKLGQ